MTVATVQPGPYSMGGAGPNYGGGYATQPWNHVVFPDDSFWDPASALALPSVGRCVSLISGQIRQMPMDDYKGIAPQPRPRLLDQPDPAQARSWFVGQQVADYLVHGNALQYVTAYDASGWPAAVTWLPASWVNLMWQPGTPDMSASYWMGGRELERARVIHAKRGADESYPVRGIGVVEQHLAALQRVANAERYEASALSSSGVPSVAVISPNPRTSQPELDDAKERWMEKFSGPVREPAILPAGSQVIPLSWSPTDAQLNQTRQLNLQDVANMFNLDGYYVGAASSSLTYRSPGPMFLQLLRITLEPLLSDLEGVWGATWLPRGHQLRFDRKQLLQDDLSTTIATLRMAVQSGLMSLEEARVYLGLPVVANTQASVTSPVATEQLQDQQPAEPAQGQQQPAQEAAA